MSKVTIEKGVKDALSDDDVKEYVKEHFDTLYKNMKYSEDRFHRSFLILFFLFAVFVFIAEASITEVSLGPFKIKELTLIYRILPVVIAYYYYVLISLGCIRVLLCVTYEAIMENIYSPLFENKLHYYWTPLHIFDVGSILGNVTEGFLSRIINFLSRFFDLIGVFLPLTFEIYAFYRCLTAFGLTDIVTWCVIVVSTLFLLQGLLFYRTYGKLIE